jgi:hypothetical protein
LVQKLTELAISLIQDILSNPKVQSVPSGDAPMPSQIEPEVDLALHTHSNAAMKLAVIHPFWTHAHAVLPVRARRVPERVAAHMADREGG